MLRGMYTSATGMVAEMHRLNTVANNLANADTIGFKSDNTVSVPFEELLLNAYNKQGVKPVGPLGLGVEAVTEFADFSNGVLLMTENSYDLAIQGDGFFVVQTPAGNRYTRAGNFTVDSQNYLVNKDGFRVLGESGPIQLEGSFEVAETGEIYLEGELANRLQVVELADPHKEGEALYTAAEALPAVNYQITQGALERSNVNSIRQMLAMIEVTRNYDTNQRALTAHDETLGKAVNDLAR